MLCMPHLKYVSIPCCAVLISLLSSAHSGFSTHLYLISSLVHSGNISVCKEHVTILYSGLHTKDHCLLRIFLEYLLILEQIKDT